MKFRKSLALILPILATAAVSTFAQTVVNSPTNGEPVGSPFTLNVLASTCSSMAVSAIGYSLDNSSYTAVFSTDAMNGPVSAPNGWHIVHVKAWNFKGGICVTDISIDVTGNATSVIPAGAVGVSSIQALSDWTAIHDGGTPGSSGGAMSLVGSPSLTGTARLFSTQFNYYGGERYAAQFDDNQTSENFFYDAWVYIANNADGFSNLEFDLNQTMSSGETVIMGFQCDSWNGTWDFAVNGGSPTNYIDTWGHSAAPCNVHAWGANQWHHMQIYYSHNTSGWVTYHSVWVDGTQYALNITAFSGFDLGWGPAEVTNFQIDGDSSGTTSGNVYLDAVTVYRW